MEKAKYRAIEEFVRRKMRVDVVHDFYHIQRVLHAAVAIARNYAIDRDVLLAACLLHDVGRGRGKDHAKKGAKMAYAFLLLDGWPEAKAAHVRDCIRTHRFRAGDAPESMEAKILFDADKLDVCGAIGIARALQYGAMQGEALYARAEDGAVDIAAENTFIAEYHDKMRRFAEAFYTKEAQEEAKQRFLPMRAFYAALTTELVEFAAAGEKTVAEWLD